MKQMKYAFLLSLFLLVCSSVFASYEISGLYLQSSARYNGRVSTTQFYTSSSLASTSTPTFGGNMPPASVVKTTVPTFGVGAWSGSAMELEENGLMSENVMMRHAIGNGNKPGNSTHVPIGRIPVCFMLLLGVLYAIRLGVKAQKG